MTRPQTLSLAILLLLAGVGPATAQGPAVSAKQFPTSYFYQYRQAPLKDNEQAPGRTDSTSK